MNAMIRTASVIALVTFWLAAIVWTVLIVAAPANAETGTTSSSSNSTASTSGSTSMSGTSTTSGVPAGPNKVTFESDAQAKMDKLVKEVAGATKVTLGPAGLNVPRK